ncbi:MAG: M81 family metallopeptidase [Alphaproteobacteria bacterium]|nr:M81 family metallopeptidase [Alphaproteobacteria bacterium]
MRAVVAMMKHETNTFSPVPTPLARFGRGSGEPWYGAAAKAEFRGTNTGFGAFLALAEAAGHEVATPIAASAAPSGPVEANAYEAMSAAILEAVDRGCDVLFLDLHGAMVAETTDDGEGTLLERIRRLKPDLPIAVALDLHANMTDRIVRHCTALVGYKTYPHIDMAAAGDQAGRIVLDAMAGKVAPAMAWGSRPMIPHTLRMGHDEAPMGPLIERARAQEKEGLLAVSVFGGFPMADIPQPGLSVVAVADRDGPRAARAALELLDQAWERRADFVYKAEPLARSVARARAMTDGPVLLIDHADNCASGGTQDTMAVIAEAMRQGLQDVAVFAVVDPGAVAAMVAAGVGAKVTLPLGGKTDMPAIGRSGVPLEVTGVVRAITDGQFTVTGPMSTGTRAHMGRSAVLDTGPMQIVVIEQHHEPFDLGAFRSVGIEPTQKRYLILKSRIHYRAGFKPIARAIVECDGEGVTSSDYSLFRFRKLNRPTYPLVADAQP